MKITDLVSSIAFDARMLVIIFQNDPYNRPDDAKPEEFHLLNKSNLAVTQYM